MEPIKAGQWVMAIIKWRVTWSRIMNMKKVQPIRSVGQKLVIEIYWKNYRKKRKATLVNQGIEIPIGSQWPQQRLKNLLTERSGISYLKLKLTNRSCSKIYLAKIWRNFNNWQRITWKFSSNMRLGNEIKWTGDLIQELWYLIRKLIELTKHNLGSWIDII